MTGKHTFKARLTRIERLILEGLAGAHTDYVSTDMLIDIVWGDWSHDEPTSAHSALRTHMLYLRRKIEFTGLEIISSPGLGYRLQIKQADDV